MRRPVIREMRSWSEIMSSATELSVSFREASMLSSFSACGTVRGNPSSTKLSHAGRRKEKGTRLSEKAACDARDWPFTYPFLHALLFSSWSRIMPTMISSETSPPASMIFLASTPSAVFFATWSRSISPVARWQTQNSSRIRGACVPLPIHTNKHHQQKRG